MQNSKYEQYSKTRKMLQKQGKAPEWMTTAGYQMLVEKNYLQTGETPIDMYARLAARAEHIYMFKFKLEVPAWLGYSNWYDAFFDAMWKGWLSPSTPVLTNMGTERGHPVACSGSVPHDSILGFYDVRKELALLTQEGYGTSVVLDPIRHRGAPISRGGYATGVTQLMDGVVDDMDKVSQGNSRRGQAGQYIDVLHKDFDEVAAKLHADPEGLNIGWTLTDSYKEMFKTNPERADHIWKKMLKTKMTVGKGYFWFKDKVNRARPQMYKDRGLYVQASNLCAEIALMSDERHSFTCVLSSVNITKYDEWKDTKLVKIATFFLDAVVEDMLIKARGKEGFEKVVRFTEKSRAIGIGMLGLTTYFQSQSWVFGDLQTRMFNKLIAKRLQADTLDVSRYLAKHVGEPEWMEGYGERFSHRTAYPPTMSTSIILGGISQGTEPVFANVFTQDTAGGNVFRINPTFLELMKEREMYTEEVMNRIAEQKGSVQEEDWLTEHEKKVFRTAFEIDQELILTFAADRQPFVCQGQSTNFYFDKSVSEEEISRLHSIAFNNEQIHSLYYIRSLNDVAKHKAKDDECLACHG